MKIAMIQCDVTTGDLRGNANLVLAACEKAEKAGAALCIAPLEAIAGPCSDFFAAMPDFETRCRATLDHMAETLADGPALICGNPFADSAAILMANGMTAGVGDAFYWNGLRFNIVSSHCEHVSGQNADICLDLRGERFLPDTQENRENKLAQAAFDHRAWILAPNLVGGYESFIYNGQSLAFDPRGRLRGRGKAFSEDLVIVDMDALSIATPPCADSLEAQWLALTLGTRDFIHKAKAKTAVLGLSGGMDSALVACIAADALGPENVTGALMPSPYSSDSSITDARELAANLGIATITLPIEETLKALNNTLAQFMEDTPSRPGDLTFENLQARIRGMLLMAISNRSGALVLNTGNKSELAMGYCTLYGDTAGAVAVLGDLLKTRVYELARWYCGKSGKMIIPQNIFDKEPSAELRPGQKDTDSLPPYNVLDPIIESLLAGRDPENMELAGEISARMTASRFKARQCPPPLLVSGEPLTRLA